MRLHRPQHATGSYRTLRAIKQYGWARRNIWGILALVPITIAFLAVYVERSGITSVISTPQAVEIEPDGWAIYDGARIRLVELSPAKDVRDATGKFFKLPDGIAAWRAVLEYDVTDQKMFAQCELSLEDSAGRIFRPQPMELAGARLPATGCTAEDQTLSRYQTFIYFVTPAGAVPSAVRVARGSGDYARLTLQ